MLKCFISYSHLDSPFVVQLADALKDDLNIWVDKRKMLPGISLMQQIATAISVSDYVTPILSNHSISSEWVRKEYEIADIQRVKLLPIKLDKCQVPPDLARLFYVDFGKLGFNEGVTTFLQMIDREVVSQGRFKLARFIIYGDVRLRFPDPFTAMVSTIRRTYYGGLVFDEPIYIAECKWLQLKVDGAEKCDFRGWERADPRMLRIELEDQPVYCEDRNDRAPGDPSYLRPRNGIFRYPIPRQIIRRGSARKLEVVVGRGHIKNLRIALSLV